MRSWRTAGAAHFSLAVWIVPAILYSADAGAWGLYTHMYYTQLLIWAVPLLDGRFRRALQRFPELCLAGTCLPDLSLFSRAMRSPAMAATHQWTAALAMLRAATRDEERAMALGYATHLLTDIVAHNYFVPTHERLWLHRSMLTHASAEWAMDAHVAAHLFVRPEALMARHQDALGAYAEQHLGLERNAATRALHCLRTGEKVLRASRLPQLVYRATRRLDPRLPARFDEYVSETAARLRQINRLIAGETPAWLPEIGSDEGPARASETERPGPNRLLLPVDWFRDAPTH
jgi:hypothetical protein